MKPFFIINPENPDNFYALFFLIAVFVCFVYLLIEGNRRKFPIMPWMMVIATAFLFFMMGTRLITFSKAEWNYVIHLMPIPYSTSRSVLGGILFCIPGILLAKKCLRFQGNMVDVFAYVLPLALAIQRFGCFIAGCCFGTPSDLPWAVVYGNNSHAFSQHVHAGLISAKSATALPVHPVQIYEVLSCIVIIILLIKIRKLIKAPGNLFLSSVGLYGVFRFLLEFMRGRHITGEFEFIFNTVQWIILLIVPLLLLFIIRQERKFTRHKMNPDPLRNEFLRPAGYFSLLFILFLFASRWLGILEIVSFYIVFLSMLAMVVWYLFAWLIASSHRLTIVFLPVGALLLMSQTTPKLEKKDSIRSSYNTLSIGGMQGNADMIYGADFSGSCFDDGKRTSYTNDYSAVGLGFAHTTQFSKRSTTFGMNGFYGKHGEYVSNTYNNTGSSNHSSMLAINPYAQFNQSNFGFGVGLHLGEFTRIVGVKSGDPTSVKQYNVYPSFRFRVGSLTSIFFEYKFADQFPAAFPALNHQLALGFGFTKKGVWRGGGIRFGTASNTGFFVDLSTGIGEHLILETYLGGYGGLLNPYDYTHNSIGSISIHVKF